MALTYLSSGWCLRVRKHNSRSSPSRQQVGEPSSITSMGEYIHASLLLRSQTSPLSFRSNIVARQCLACNWWGFFLFKCCKLWPACLCHRRPIKVLQTWLLVAWDSRPCWLQAMAPCWCLVAARGCCRRHSSAVSDKSGHGRRNWRTCSRAFTSWSSWWVAWRSHITSFEGLEGLILLNQETNLLKSLDSKSSPIRIKWPHHV